MVNTEPNYGRLLANRYRLLDLVGKGAMGRVYRAEDTLLGGVTVAVKFLSQSLLNQRMRDRFVQEATICAKLGEKSIHIVRVTDYGVDGDDVPFYVMEFLPGENLSNLIKLRPLTLSRFLKLARQICVAVERAHQGIVVNGELCHIVHRDLKPSNIIIIEDPTLKELVKVVDFGIAQIIQESKAQTSSFMGTLAYCSPEQMDGKELDSRSDIYSLGVMMYEMLSSEMPLLPENQSFGGWYQTHCYSQPKPFNPSLNIPPALEELILKCLAKAPSDRPQSIAEILPVLEKVELSQRKKPVQAAPLKDKQEQPAPAKAFLSFDQECQQTSWPENKPQEKIVFPRLLPTSKGIFPVLQVMLDPEDVAQRTSCTRYNQFLFLPSPHPLLLWLTVLYHPQHGPRWLPCYLDLKTKNDQQIACLLGEIGSYSVLLFALGEPQHCQHVLNLRIVAEQCKLLKDWVAQSQSLPAGLVQVSKKLLKQELNQLKSQILKKLAVYNSVPIQTTHQ